MKVIGVMLLLPAYGTEKQHRPFDTVQEERNDICRAITVAKSMSSTKQEHRPYLSPRNSNCLQNQTNGYLIITNPDISLDSWLLASLITNEKMKKGSSARSIILKTTLSQSNAMFLQTDLMPTILVYQKLPPIRWRFCTHALRKSGRLVLV